MSADLAIHAKPIARALLGEPNKALSTKDQLRYGTNGSLAIEITGEDAGAWFDHEQEVGGGLLDLIRREKGFTNGECFDWLRSIGIEPGERQAKQKVVANYVYVDAKGNPVFRVSRWGPKKTFTQSRFDPERGEYVSGKGCMEGVRRVPYRLDRLEAAELVLIPEGEKDADRLDAIGLEATCNAGGAGKWSRGYAPYFADKRVVILPDNDQAGRDHAKEVAECLMPVATSVKLLELPELPERGDVTDWLDAGGTIDQLRDLIRGAPDASEVIAGWAQQEPVPDDLEDNVVRLASFGRAEYDKVRKAEAKKLGIRASTLDKEVEQRRPAIEPEIGEGKGSPLGLVDPEPWHDPVDGAELIDDVVAALQRYVILPERTARAVALWSIHAHTMEFATVAPRLLITAPTRECGKTVLLDTVGRLVPRALPAANISPAGIFRTTEVVRPTLMIDEADTFLKDNDELRGVINSGHTRASAFVIRVVDVGGDHEPRKFSTWCSMAVCGIGSMPGTITSRSIVVKMERKLPGERVARLTHRTGQELDVICRKIVRWVEDNRVKLEAAEPDIPEQLGNRTADNWCELLAIADLAGGDWPAKAREVALARVAEDDGEVMSIQLLAAIKTVFDETGADKLLSSTIAEKLVEMEGQPWAEFGRSRKPITQNGIARLLKVFKIAPGNIRVGDKVPKGYERSAFVDAWERYLEPEGGSQPLRRYNQTNPPCSEDSQPLRHDPDVADENRLKAPETAACSAVADENGVSGEREIFEI